MVIPDSKQLLPAVKCEWNEQMQPTNCVLDEKRVSIDMGYLRQLIELLTICNKRTI